jgi:hypothetical protein
MYISDSGFVSFSKEIQTLNAGIAIDWGRRDDALIIPLNSEPGAVYLQEGGNDTVHRVEQSQIAVTAQSPWTVEVVARSAGRSGIMIELRDAQPGAYTRAKYDLEQIRVIECADDTAAIGALDERWVSCQLTLTPSSSAAVLAITLLDGAGMHIYPGKELAGVQLRPPVLYAVRATQAA